ncbi:methyltransferase domain-containing protein [candidate division KSB1 bacterium]|nr:MAG: methyltransferase domain-containing protein [candidate division KSB1 bacterium]
MKAILHSFLAANRRACDAMEKRLSLARDDIHAAYIAQVIHKSKTPGSPWIADVGSGRKCDYLRGGNNSTDIRSVALDVSAAELRLNSEISVKLQCDVSQGIPLADRCLDGVTACRLIEHLPHPENFISECCRVLKPNGFLVLFFPQKYALFATIKRLLPERLVTRIIRFIYYPESLHFCWSPLYYRHCCPAAMEKLLRRHGFEVSEVRVGYYQSQYFKSFLPLFLISVLCDWLTSALHLRNLGAYSVVTATRV